MAKMARKKIYAILRGREGVINDVEVFNTNQEEAWVIFRKIYENQPGILSGARITFQSQPYYYASNGSEIASDIAHGEIKPGVTKGVFDIKNQEFWFHQKNAVYGKEKGTLFNEAKKAFAEQMGAEDMILVKETDKDYVFELIGDQAKIISRTNVLEKENEFDVESWGFKRRVTLPKELFTQTEFAARFPDIIFSANGTQIGQEAPGGPAPEDKQPDRSRYASPIKIVIFKHKNNPRLVITVKAYPSMSIAEIENPFNVRFPYFVGQVLNMGHRTWACNNGYLVNDEDPCPEKKIFGMRAKDIPQGHPLRHLYPGKFRVDGGIAANGAEVDAGLERVKEIQKKYNYSVLDLRRKDRWSDDRYNGQGSKKPIAETDIIVRTNKSFYSIIDSPPSSATKESVEELRKLIGTQVNNGTLVDVIATIRGYYDNPTYSAGPYVEYFYVLDSPRSNDNGMYGTREGKDVSAKDYFKGKKVVDSVDKDSILGYVIKKVIGERAFMQDGGGIEDGIKKDASTLSSYFKDINEANGDQDQVVVRKLKDNSGIRIYTNNWTESDNENSVNAIHWGKDSANLMSKEQLIQHISNINSKVVTIATYAELLDLKNKNNLIKNKIYLVTDKQSFYESSDRGLNGPIEADVNSINLEEYHMVMEDIVTGYGEEDEGEEEERKVARTFTLKSKIQ